MATVSFSQRLFLLLRKRRLRPLFIAVLVGLIIMEIVALSPSSLEGGGEKTAIVEPETLIDDEQTLASGIPKDKIAEYSIDQFQYVSTQGSEKQWKLVADKAYLYNKEKIVHSRNIHAYLYDPDGKITVVEGKEAKYFMNQRDLEIFGKVHTVFPDGFKLDSEYLRYRPREKLIDIPVKYAVHGNGDEAEGQHMRFDSQGMEFEMRKKIIVLPQSVHLVSAQNDGDTIIDSDRAVIHRSTQIANFTMFPSRPLATRFVRITQPTLGTRGRRADLHYGDASKSQKLQYMVVFEDVLIRDLGKSADAKPGEPTVLKYATGGRADFDARSDIIRLTDFPQAYQDNDTITGDVIIIHRDTDLVEVEHSNAYSEGT
jgi:LPS export ABC transporter protein LptC